jgi:hypothetical protein
MSINLPRMVTIIATHCSNTIGFSSRPHCEIKTIFSSIQSTGMLMMMMIIIITEPNSVSTHPQRQLLASDVTKLKRKTKLSIINEEPSYLRSIYEPKNSFENNHICRDEQKSLSYHD